MVVGDKVGHCHKIIAVGAVRARAEAPAPGVAVVAALGAEVAGLALRAFVHGVDLGGLGGAGCCPPAAPGGLAAGVGAPPTAVKSAPHCPHTVVAVSLRTPVTGRSGPRTVVAVSLRTPVTGVLSAWGGQAGRCEMPGMSRCFTRP